MGSGTDLSRTGRLLAAAFPGNAASANARRRSWIERNWMDDAVEEYQRTERMALAGREVLYEHLKVAQHRTLTVNGLEFKRFRSLAKTSRRVSLCCLPVASPVGTVANWW